MEAPQLTFRQFERADEARTVLKAWKNAKEQMKGVQVVLVGGKSGSGKTSLIASTLESIKPYCFHGVAKFESGGRSSLPFAPLRQLLGDICSGILSSEKDVLDRCRAFLCRGLSPAEVGVLISVIPRIGDVLRSEEEDDDDDDGTKNAGSNSQASSLTKDGLNVLKLALRSFFRVIVGVRPVVLCLDDLMWSDEATLYTLQSLLTDVTLKGLLFCATYREEADSESLSSSKELEKWTQLLRENLPHEALHLIHLTNLRLDQVSELLSSSMRGKEDVNGIAEVFYSHTHGNLFFMSQFLDHLQATELLVFDFGSMQWTWDIDEVRRRAVLSDNVLKVVSARLERLPHQGCRVLQLASCFGARFSLEAVNATAPVLDINIDCVMTSLEYLCEQVLLIQLNERCYKFSHDTIQLAAYSLFADEFGDDVDRAHWDIGCKFMELPSLEQDDWLFFACVDQLNMGREIARSREDRQKLSQLNLKAGEKAAAMSAFMPASEYLRVGIEALGEEPFRADTEYQFAIPLHTLFSKTEYCIGHIDESRVMADLVVTNARTAAEKESPYLTLIDCYFAEGKSYELIDFCLDRLEDLGEKMPRTPNSMRQLLEETRMKHLLRGKSDQDLLGLPTTEKETKSLAIRILCEMVMVLHQQGRSALLGVVVANMLRITLRHGMTRFTPVAFTAIGAYLSSRGDVKEGHRIGSIGEIMLQRDSRKELKGRSYFWIACCTKWWVEPIPLSLDLFIAGNEYCMASGSIAFACHCHVLYAAVFFCSGLALEPLVQDVEKFANLMLEYRQPLPFLMITPLWQCLLNLIGESDEPQNLEAGKAYERRKSLPNRSEVGQIVTYSYWMQLSFFHGNIDKAHECAKLLKQEFTGLTKAMVFYPVRLFFFALIAIAKHRESKVSNIHQRRKYKIEAEKHTKTLRRLVVSGAINIVHKVQLLETELLSLSPKTATERVRKMYDTAIVSARRAGFLQDAALANYLCFQFCKSRDEHEAAEDYLRNSHDGWNDWNAYTVANSLAERFPGVLDPSSATMKRSSGAYRSRVRYNASLRDQHQHLSL